MAPQRGPPQALIDAGDTAWDVLAGLVERHLAELNVGDIVEVVSSRSGLRADLADWCARTGHELVQAVDLPDGTACSIRQRSLDCRRTLS